MFDVSMAASFPVLFWLLPIINKQNKEFQFERIFPEAKMIILFSRMFSLVQFKGKNLFA